MSALPSVAFRSMMASAALLTGLVAGPASLSAQETISVLLDRAKIIQMPEGTSTVVIGNPGVADVTMLKKQGRMVLTAKGFGETNMIALDAQGNSIGESIVRVIAPDHALIVQRGAERESYSCTPRCQPTVNLGDTPRFMGEAASQVQARNGFAGSGGGK